jgi:uncharacterized phage protein (TIGR02220 family)
MAENKKSFTAYCDWNETFNSLPDEKAGQLIKHLFAYVNDENPVTDDLLINAVFANIKATLKRDLIKWKEKSEKNKQIAIDRWNKNTSKSIDKDANVCERIKTDANCTDSVSVSVSDNVINNNIIEPINWPVLLDFFNKTTGKKCKVVPKKAKEQFNARLKEGFTKVDIANAIVNASNDEYHIKEDLKYITLEFISRADKLDKFSQIKNESGTTNQKLMKYDDSGQIL